MNSITIYGRMVEKPILKTASNGDEYAAGNIASNNGSKHEKSALFFHFNAYGSAGQYACNYLIKGDPVFIIGELRASMISNNKPILYISKIQKIGRRPQQGEVESINEESILQEGIEQRTILSKT